MPSLPSSLASPEELDSSNRIPKSNHIVLPSRSDEVQAAADECVRLMNGDTRSQNGSLVVTNGKFNHAKDISNSNCTKTPINHQKQNVVEIDFPKIEIAPQNRVPNGTGRNGLSSEKVNGIGPKKLSKLTNNFRNCRPEMNGLPKSHVAKISRQKQKYHHCDTFSPELDAAC